MFLFFWKENALAKVVYLDGNIMWVQEISNSALFLFLPLNYHSDKLWNYQEFHKIDQVNLIHVRLQKCFVHIANLMASADLNNLQTINKNITFVKKIETF